MLNFRHSPYSQHVGCAFHLQEGLLCTFPCLYASVHPARHSFPSFLTECWPRSNFFHFQKPQCLCVTLHSAFINSNLYFTHWYFFHPPWFKTKSLIRWVPSLSFVFLFSNKKADLEDSITVLHSKSLWGNRSVLRLCCPAWNPHSKVTTVHIKCSYCEKEWGL